MVTPAPRNPRDRNVRAVGSAIPRHLARVGWIAGSQGGAQSIVAGKLAAAP